MPSTPSRWPAWRGGALTGNLKGTHGVSRDSRGADDIPQEGCADSPVTLRVREVRRGNLHSEGPATRGLWIVSVSSVGPEVLFPGFWLVPHLTIHEPGTNQTQSRSVLRS